MHSLQISQSENAVQQKLSFTPVLYNYKLVFTGHPGHKDPLRMQTELGTLL